MVSGIDFEFRDERAEPAFVLPFDGLDLEVRGVTTRALTSVRKRLPSGPEPSVLTVFQAEITPVFATGSM